MGNTPHNYPARRSCGHCGALSTSKPSILPHASHISFRLCRHPIHPSYDLTLTVAVCFCCAIKGNTVEKSTSWEDEFSPRPDFHVPSFGPFPRYRIISRYPHSMLYLTNYYDPVPVPVPQHRIPPVGRKLSTSTQLHSIGNQSPASCHRV